MKKLHAVRVGLVAVIAACVSTLAAATAPTYLTDATTAATSQFADGLGVAVPFFFATITTVAVVYLVAGFIKKAMKGR